MYRLGEPKNETRMGRFFVLSITLHLLLLLYPQWEASRVSGILPGDGALQFTLTTPQEVSSLSMQRVAPTNAVPSPQARPTQLQAAQVPVSQVQVAERPQSRPEPVAQVPVQTPQVNPAPAQQVPPREQVQPVRPTVPQPDPRPPSTEAVPESALPVVTSDAGAVPVAAQSENEPAVSSTLGDSVVDFGLDEGATGEEVAPPPPPPPPPPVGSMLRFPGGMFIPKNYERSWGSVSVRVLITVDERGNIVDARIDPQMRAPNESINDWALAYARQLIHAQPGPEGEAYEAAFVVTFDPEALGADGVRFGTDPDELIRLLGSE